jgi:hypothetical protein
MFLMCPELVQHYGMRQMLAAQMYSAIALVCACSTARSNPGTRGVAGARTRDWMTACSPMESCTRFNAHWVLGHCVFQSANKGNRNVIQAPMGKSRERVRYLPPHGFRHACGAS